MSFESEISRRRTFAIISHPDAGKTTLTEKLLLYGGALQAAGSVRAKKNQKNTTSDWMDLERERGITIKSKAVHMQYKAQDGETYTPISGDATVSLNFWIFRHSIFDELEARFHAFLKVGLNEKPLKAEYYLPSVPNQLLAEKKATVSVLPTSAKWFGMTYLEDLAETKANIRRMKDEGAYPERLWERG